MDFFSALSHLDWSQIGQLTFQHLLLVLVVVGLMILVDVPLGVLMARFMWLVSPLQGAATMILIIPSVTLFGLLMPIYSIFGQGLRPLPAITAAFLYLLLLILRNTYLVLTGIEAGIREAGKDISTTFWQCLRAVDIPLVVPVILAGVRTAMVMNIGVVTIAMMIGTGDLGMLILTSINQNNMPILVVDAVLVSLLAIVADLLLQWLQCIFTPKGLHASAH